MGEYFPVCFSWHSYSSAYKTRIKDLVTCYFPRLQIAMEYGSILPHSDHRAPGLSFFISIEQPTRLTYKIFARTNKLRTLRRLLADRRLNYSLLYMNIIAGSRHRDLSFA